ncbi:hypothetical protein D3C77_575810 [compost metagenome]
MRDKHVVLTTRGEKCCYDLLQIKQGIERQIVEKLGKEQVEELKSLLQSDWLKSD